MLEEGQYRDRQNLTLVRIAVNLGARAYLIEHALAYGQIIRSDNSPCGNRTIAAPHWGGGTTMIHNPCNGRFNGNSLYDFIPIQG
jgi:hypothetical protein